MAFPIRDDVPVMLKKKPRNVHRRARTNFVSFTVIIPARYASQRLPGKPLLDIDGKTYAATHL
ncbi:MAG: hypothetical protein CM1200mP40_34010 [Gammaproteobacteria bacterium]|nr:MAG: hypothetical protein CM1200mP40_34010 [Gammaproteobacteria bacterium]